MHIIRSLTKLTDAPLSLSLNLLLSKWMWVTRTWWYLNNNCVRIKDLPCAEHFV